MGSFRCLIVPALAFTTTLVGQPRAARADAPLTLEWSGACNQDERVVAEVTRLVAGSTVPPLRASVVVSRISGGYAAELTTLQEGATGVRRFEARTCAKLVDATILVLMVLLAPVEAAEEVRARPPPEPSPPPTPAPPPRPAAAPPAPTGAWGVAFGPELGAGIGVLPGPSLFASAEIWLLRSGARVGAAGSIWTERPVSSDSGEQVADIGLRTASLRGCVRLAAGTVHLDGCAAGEIGAYSGRGVGIRAPREASPFWAAFGPGLTLLSDGRLSSSVGLYAPIALVRPAFQITGIGEVYRPAPVSLRLAIATELNLP